MNFKFLTGIIEEEYTLTLSGFEGTGFIANPAQILVVGGEYDGFPVTEYCFQFDNDDPLVIASSQTPMTLELQPNAFDGVTFTQNNKKFKIFARTRE